MIRKKPKSGKLAKKIMEFVEDVKVLLIYLAEPPMMAPAPLQAPDRAEVQSLSTKRVVKDLMLSYGA